jgi:hypothetical protein
LEVLDGPQTTTLRPSRGRSYSISGFNFQHDLIPLTASLSEPDTLHDGTEKNINLLNGKLSSLSMYALVVSSTPSKGVALIAGLQVAFQSATMDLHVHSHFTPDRFWHIVRCSNAIPRAFQTLIALA